MTTASSATPDLSRIESIELRPSARELVERAAQAAYPHEACGVLIGEALDGTVRIVEAVTGDNLERDRPHDRYRLDPSDYVAADRHARRRGLEIVGFWHSHPDHPAEPSRTDLENAWPGYVYLIVTSRARQAGRIRSWRLSASGFHEQTIRQEDPR